MVIKSTKRNEKRKFRLKQLSVLKLIHKIVCRVALTYYDEFILAAVVVARCFAVALFQRMFYVLQCLFGNKQII